MFIAFAGREYRKTAARLYFSAVRQARDPWFYRDLGAPDTVTGRFDLLSLHIFLLIDRLNRAGRKGRGVAQALFDQMFIDMDRSIRELGVGDLSVPKHIKRMMKGFNGRCRAYADALASGDEAALRQALARNVYAGAARIEPTRLAAFDAYVRDSAAALASQQDTGLLDGDAVFSMKHRDEDCNDVIDCGMVA